MRRLRHHHPCRFHPATLRSSLRQIGLTVNRAAYLFRKYQIGKIGAEEFETFKRLTEASEAVILVDHSDPLVTKELAHRDEMRAIFVAAREISEVSPSGTVCGFRGNGLEQSFIEWSW